MSTPPESTPHLTWAQRREKIFITWDYIGAQDVSVDFGESELSFRARVGDKTYAMGNVPLSGKVVPAECKWFGNDRCVQAILKKAEAEWWDTLVADKTYKPYVKVDWSKWVEEEDAEYDGPGAFDFAGSYGADYDDDDMDSDDDDVPLDDLDIEESPAAAS